MKQLLCVMFVLTGVVFATGCSDEKKSDPKSTGPADPRLKPAGTGGSGAATPKAAVKGD